MSYITLRGSKFFVSTGLGTAVPVSDMSNTLPSVVTANAHGYANNDEVLLNVGWEDFDQAVFRIASVATNTFALPGYDASNTDWYPNGSDTGTVQKISGWQEIGQVLGITGQGGDAKYEEVDPFDKRNGVRQPVGFNPSSMEMTLGWDASRADQQALQAASRVLGKRAFKFALPGGTRFAYGYGTVAMSVIPIFEPVLKTRLAVSFDGLFTSF